MSKPEYDLNDLTFSEVRKFARRSTTLQKEISTDLKKTGVFDRDRYLTRALGYVEKLQKINADVWGDGFEEERQQALVWMWEMFDRIQKSKAPAVEAERAGSWTKADREAYETATFITLEEAEREGI